MSRQHTRSEETTRSSRIRSWTKAFSVFVVCCVCVDAVFVAPDTTQAVFRSTTDAVLLDVLPTERGQVVTGLRQQDLEIRDNGTPQAITHFSNDVAALGVYLLLDTSGSLTKPDLAHLQQGAATLASALRAGDELTLITFSEAVRLHGVRTASTLPAAFEKLEPAGNTSLHDALTTGLRLADRGSGLRPVVIAFSDGHDTASWLTARDVNEAARMSWAAFYGVTPAAAPAPLLQDLAQLTGGDVLKLTGDLTTLPKAFQQILERLRQRYLVGFTPTSAAAGWHELDVKVKRANVKVLARRGYLRR